MKWVLTYRDKDGVHSCRYDTTKEATKAYRYCVFILGLSYAELRDEDGQYDGLLYYEGGCL